MSVAVLTVLVSATPQPAAASDRGRTLQERYEAGARAYWAGDTATAYATWQELQAYDLRSSGLLYALGNAAYRLGRMGEAKAWFERARRLSPHDGDVLANLDAVDEALAGANVVRVVKVGTAAGEGTFEWWYRLFTRLTPGQLAVLFLLFHLLFFGALLARRWMERGMARRLLLVGNIPVFIAAGVLGTLLAGAAYVHRDVEVAVAIEGPTPVRDGPTPDSAVLFEVPEGQLLRLSDRTGPWRRAKVNDDLQGWVDMAHLMGVQ